MDAEAALVRRSSPEQAVTSLALFGDTARLVTAELRFQADGAAEAVRTRAGWVVEGVGKVTVHD
jgi:hypothetical protein